MKKTLLILTLSLFLATGCYDIIGSNDVFELNNITLTVTDTESTNYHWRVNGMIINNGDSSTSTTTQQTSTENNSNSSASINPKEQKFSI